MNKALEILKEFKSQIETCPDDCWFELKQVIEAIAELEEAMKPKTCAGCYYEPLHDFELPCKSCKRNSSDFYKKPKDKA